MKLPTKDNSSVFTRLLDSYPTILFWLGVATVILYFAPREIFDLRPEGLLVVGLIGMWRYGWYVLNFVRASIYRLVKFPAVRKRMLQVSNPDPDRLYFVIPSYKEDEEITAMVFPALVREVASLNCKRAVAVVAVGTQQEADFIRSVVEQCPDRDRVELVFMVQHMGKRIAMGHALRAVSRDYNSVLNWTEDANNDLVIFMDGDSLMEEGCLRKSLGYFRLDERMGGLTTDEEAVIFNASGMVKRWYTLKFRRRHVMMQSQALSNKVLTLTGRFSVFRAPLVLEEEFIRDLESDHLDHWLFGRFRFLMGDDKSTWFSLLRDGWRMQYVSDTVVYSMESRSENFSSMSRSLMFRWSGNMLRNNARALRLGPWRTGLFTWWAILDQRVSMWTTLLGPVAMLMLALFDSWLYIALYGVWLIITRLTQLIMLVLHGLRMRLPDLALQVYDQWLGAAVKVFGIFHQNRQSWSKGGNQNVVNADDDIPYARTRNFAATSLMWLYVAIFLFAVAVLTDVLRLPAFIG